MPKLKVLTVVGTRPEIIRLSRVIARLDEAFDQRLVHTGQNWDYRLNEIFFDDLDLRRPDVTLDFDTSSLGAGIGSILAGVENQITEFRPDAFLVLGDTNSALSVIIARRLKIPIYHMEAGNRSFDLNVPEETNRRIIDHVADFNLVYTEHARRHLLSEGLGHRRIYLTGSPMAEVLNHYQPKIAASKILEELNLQPKGYFIASLHREENVDNKERLVKLVDALKQAVDQYDRPVVLSAHPRTVKRLAQSEVADLDKSLIVSPPLSFTDYNKLQMHAFCAISDSGTIAEEAAILNFPAITPRDAIERPEALDTGAVVVTGVQPASILTSIAYVTAQHDPERSGERLPADYRIMNTSQRVANLIAGTASLSNGWDGIREKL